ncbi:MAG: hypothetical protein ACK4MV_19955 [Beijerinckiaceae bacterium]
MSQPFEGAGPRRHADELRHDIDAGRTGDKVSNPDPAAAPLGTDDEAAGYAPSSHAVRRAMGEEGALRQPEHESAALLEGGPAYAFAGLIVIAVLVMMFYSITNLR